MMGNEMAALILVTGVAHLLSAFRLACYQRDDKDHRWRVGLLTSLLGGMSCIAGMDVLLAFEPVSLWHTVTSVLSCVVIIRSGGKIIVLWSALKP
ncbi:phage holin family protein [Pseudomonas sp. NPDC089569]|uniref:phage holin family protein n=1 Tax=Pseudomonas sp. NPDC089569 TaxID=3390722 RepID=UPI003D00DBC9